jgi:ribosomal protein S25
MTAGGCSAALKSRRDRNARRMAKSAPTITPIYRVAWADMVANDSRVSAIAVRIAIIVGAHFNNVTAETYVGQTTVAAKAGVSARTAWEALRCLVECGHLTVRRGGRRSNIYGMPLQNIAAYCETYFKKSRSPLRNMPLEISQSSALNFATGCEQTLLTNSIDSETAEMATPQGRTWRAVLTSLTDEYGREKAAAWFYKLTFVGVHDCVCILRAPSGFIKSWIDTNYAEPILQAWRAQDSGIVRIEIETPRAKRASGGAA